MHPAVEAGLAALHESALQTQIRVNSAAQALVGTGSVYDPRVGLTTTYDLFNKTPYSEDRTNPPLMVCIHETATYNATGRSLNRRHTRPDLPPQNRASWNDIIEREDGEVLLYTDRVAWHAGKSQVPRGRWKGQGSTFVRLNMWGIELVGPNNGRDPVTARQKDSLARRIRQLEIIYGREFNREDSLYEHHEIAIPLGRKTDSTGCSGDEIMRRVLDLRGIRPTPIPERPPVGDYFVNVAIALLRAGPSQKDKILARLPRATRVFVTKWVEGQIVQGENLWGETHPSPSIEEYIHRGVLKKVPPATARTKIADAARTTYARAEVFAAKVMPTATSRRIELVDCGGYAED